MRKGLLLLAVLTTASAAAGLATPPKNYVYENFEGASFPPQGWSVETAPIAYWKRVQEGGNAYAEGYVYTYEGPPAAAWLWSHKFSLTAGTRVRIRFRYRGGPVDMNSSKRVSLCYDRENTVWYINLGRQNSWILYDRTTSPVPSTRDDYQLLFFLGVVPYPGREISTDMHIDDVVTEEFTAVDPTSLGRVRALYR